MNDSVTPALEFAIPKPRRAVIGAIIGTSFLVFFITLAIYDLSKGQAIIPSLIWLLLVCAMLFGFCKQDGVKMVAINILGVYSRDEFIQTIRHDGTPDEIHLGYRFLGFRFLYLSIGVDRITEIHWHTGQGSSLRGRDIGDWSVALWYEHREPEKSRKQPWSRHPDCEVYIVGLSGPKEETNAFGLAVVDFLRRSGVPLVQGKDDCTFVRQGSQS